MEEAVHTELMWLKKILNSSNYLFHASTSTCRYLHVFGNNEQEYSRKRTEAGLRSGLARFTKCPIELSFFWCCAQLQRALY